MKWEPQYKAPGISKGMSVNFGPGNRRGVVLTVDRDRGHCTVQELVGMRRWALLLNGVTTPEERRSLR